MEKCSTQSVEQFVDSFRQENRGAGLRVFVAGGRVPGMIRFMLTNVIIWDAKLQKWISGSISDFPAPELWERCPRRFGRLEQKAMRRRTDTGHNHQRILQPLSNR